MDNLSGRQSLRGTAWKYTAEFSETEETDDDKVITRQLKADLFTRLP